MAQSTFTNGYNHVDWACGLVVQSDRSKEQCRENARALPKASHVVHGSFQGKEPERR